MSRPFDDQLAVNLAAEFVAAVATFDSSSTRHSEAPIPGAGVKHFSLEIGTNFLASPPSLAKITLIDQRLVPVC